MWSKLIFWFFCKINQSLIVTGYDCGESLNIWLMETLLSCNLQNIAIYDLCFPRHAWDYLNTFFIFSLFKPLQKHNKFHLCWPILEEQGPCNLLQDKKCICLEIHYNDSSSDSSSSEEEIKTIKKKKTR